MSGTRNCGGDTASHPPGFREWSVIGVLLIALVAVGLPLTLAITSGSISIPHNDSWAYSRIAVDFARTGSIHLINWNRASLVGQFVPLGPLGRLLVLQQCYVAVLALVTLGCVYQFFLARAEARTALVLTAVMMFFPGFGLLATSFMEDVPMLAGVFGCLVLGDVALRRNSQLVLVLAVLAGLWGFTVREQALAAPVAVLIAYYVQLRGSGERGLRSLSPLLTISVIAVSCVVAFEKWRRALPNSDTGNSHFSPHIFVNGCIASYFTLALLVCPVVLTRVDPRRWSRSATLVAGLTALLAVYGVIRLKSGLLLGNYFDRYGPYPAAGNGLRHPIPAVLWAAAVCIAVVSGVLLSGAVVTHWRQLDLPLGLFTVMTILGTVYEIAQGQQVFDRGMLVFIPAAALLAVESKRSVPRIRLRAEWGAVTILALVSLLVTMNGLAYDAARWHAAQQLHDHSGIPVSDIDAGLEWVGWHYTGVTVQSDTVNSLDDAFPGTRSCVVVSATPVSGVHVVATYTYRTWVIAGSSRIYAYQKAHCPTQ